ncbi:MAG: hypothetical protein ACI841_003035 [Planctomycetota bacterium]|jgi:hypothetical protein
MCSSSPIPVLIAAIPYISKVEMLESTTPLRSTTDIAPVCQIAASE